MGKVASQLSSHNISQRLETPDSTARNLELPLTRANGQNDMGPPAVAP
jgi:hypothetical protein